MLKIYNRGEHKGGFIGVRIAVMVGGKHRQKYFSYKNSNKSKEAIYKDAEQVHREWLMLKNLASTETQRESKELRRLTSPYSTGVKGIKFSISHSRAYFFVQGSTDNKLFYKNFSINDYGYDLAWYKACEFLQSNKDYSIFDNIYKRKPQKEMLLITFRHLFFTTNKQIHFESISSIIEEPIFINWLKQLARQYSDNKAFKEKVFEYISSNKIYDKELLDVV
ncbi:MAG: hypothetical protein L3J51_13385 [Cocleimonas sp.]|nr:hypothetical protein [Cocleimonas sp.]